MTREYDESLGMATFISVLAGIAGVAGSYAAAGLTPSFVVSPVESFTSSVMPGSVITFAITVLGDLGQKLSLFSAGLLVALVLASLSLAAVVTGRRLGRPLVSILLAAGLAWLATVVITGAPMLALAAGLPVGAVVAFGELLPMAGNGETRNERRRVVASLAGVFGFGVLASVLGGDRTDQQSQVTSLEDVGAGEQTANGKAPAKKESEGNDGNDGNDAKAAKFDQPSRDQLLATAKDQSLGISGLEPLVSENFYRVTYSATDPVVDPEQWSLRLTGAVETEREFTYDDVTSLSAEDRFATLRCVGEGLNGKKIDTALWTGVPLMDLLGKSGLPDECCVMLRAADDYYEEFPLSALENAFLAYGMNGNTLPRKHGAPVRALVPGNWGEINVKWLTEIEVLERPAKGYWEKKGWHGTGPVKTVAKLHATNRLDDGRVQVGGHAYAGTRGIQKVEVSTDGGESWNEAKLSKPLPASPSERERGLDQAEDAWRQWEHTYKPPDGKHQVVVRATDGTGTLQPKKESGAFPSGPSGWVTETVK